MSNSSATPKTILGWDVGGAHLKAALIDADGVAIQVIQVACQLWRGIDKLEAAIDHILSQLKQKPSSHAITMTGELADIFPDRHAGVVKIAECVQQRLSDNVCFYAGPKGFVDLTSVKTSTHLIASANWHASASFVAKEVVGGIFIDIGSTTADIILLANGTSQHHGFSDAERMQYEELVYTGVIRTPLMAVTAQIPFAGEWRKLAAEHFATTADIYRLTGDLNEAEDMAETADGAGKTPHESARRLARMIGQDVSDASMDAWVSLALAFKQAQIDSLKSAVLRSLSRNLISRKAPIVGAGAGSFLVRELARQLDQPYIESSSLVKGKSPDEQRWAAVCLPAYAVAVLGIID
ncbi:MAG: hydantoinase/oxoprolinase family protein [Methylophilaceae bacterium]|nr:hydantoinase/oxoprolinase family protein [Methyloradius sp.]